MTHEIRTGVSSGVKDEPIGSEAGVCGLVTHEVCQFLSALPTEQARTEAVSDAARQAIMGIHESGIPFHVFSVAEAMRGVVHGVVCAGLDVSYTTRFILRGMRDGLVHLNLWTTDFEQAMRSGVHAALLDLGMSRLEDDHSLELPGLFTRDTIQFGHA